MFTYLNKIVLLVGVIFIANLSYAQEGSIITTSRSAPIGVISYAAAVTSNGFAGDKFVDGYVKKLGTTKFTFPVGDEGLYRPFAAAANGITGAYYRENPATTFTGTDVTGGPFSPTLKGEGIGTISTVEFWDINGTQPTRITLTWIGSSNVSAMVNGNLTKLLLVGFDGTKWVEIPATVDANGLLGGVSTTTAGSISTNDALVPDNYKVYALAAAPDGPLPVTLINFEGRIVESSVRLEWSTSSETNNDRFDVERRTNTSWETIESVNKQANYGFKKYIYVDNNPGTGENLYRLKMIDLDGSFAYSKVVSIHFNSNIEMISLYPNPVSERLFIKSADAGLISKISIFNVQGKMVSTLNSMPADGINVQNLSAGSYIVTLRNNSGSVSSHKVVVTH